MAEASLSFLQIPKVSFNCYQLGHLSLEAWIEFRSQHQLQELALHMIQIVGGSFLQSHKNPLPAEVHPEMDESPLLDNQGLKLYQTLIRMVLWACSIGRLDISFAVSSLSRFSATAREGHLQLAIYMFGYLKKYPNRNLVIELGSLLVPEEFTSSTFQPDFLEDYPDAQEDIDPMMLVAFGSELETSIFFMQIMHTTRRHADPFLGLSSLSDAPQFCGQVAARITSPLPRTVRSSLRCARP